jgi:hypothetical protein
MVVVLIATSCRSGYPITNQAQQAAASPFPIQHEVSWTNLGEQCVLIAQYRQCADCSIRTGNRRLFYYRTQKADNAIALVASAEGI